MFLGNQVDDPSLPTSAFDGAQLADLVVCVHGHAGNPAIFGADDIPETRAFM